MSLTFFTGVRFYRNIIDAMNRVTFIYDPEWSIDNFPYPTLPVSFFHVKSMHEVMTSEVSQKQMLFYSSNSSPDNSTANAGVLNVVADNIVIKPKTYKLDIIVPYHDLSLLNQSFMFNTHTLQAVNQAFLKGTSVETKNLAALSSMAYPMLGIFNDIIKTLLVKNLDDTDIGDWTHSIMEQPDYNKNSLEAMWMLRRIVKMKVWNSWTYKYVAITDIDISKEGTEDGVYEATMTVQEVPIATLKSIDASGKKFTYNNKIFKGQGEKAKKLLDKLETKIS